MTLPLLIVLAATHLEDTHLVVLAVGHNRGLDACAGNQGSPDLQVSAVTDSQHLVDRDLLANVRSNLFYLDLFAGSNLVLLPAGFYDRVHISPFMNRPTDKAERPTLKARSPRVYHATRRPAKRE